MIHSGEKAIGKPIVLIEYYVITVNDGKLVCVELLPKYKKIKKICITFYYTWSLQKTAAL